VRNAGNTLWQSVPRKRGGHVALGVELISPDGQLVSDGLGRTILPHNVAGGEQVKIKSTFQLPQTLGPGAYLLRFDMVDEQVSWFGHLGSCRVERELTVVRPASPINALPDE
jgi:hypothetical protein